MGKMKDNAIERQNKDKARDEAEYQRRAFLLDPHHGNADPDTPENRERLRRMGLKDFPKEKSRAIGS